MKALRLFPTKKRSSRSLWIFWLLFFSFVTAVGASLTVIELFLLSNQRVVYTSIRGSNIEDRRVFQVKGEAFIAGQDPVFFFGKDEVIIGTSQSLTAPSPDGNVLVIPKENWHKTIVSEVLKSEVARSLFPANIFGVMYSTKYADVFTYSDLLILVEKVRTINLDVNKEYKLHPVPYLLGLRSGLTGVN